MRKCTRVRGWTTLVVLACLALGACNPATQQVLSSLPPDPTTDPAGGGGTTEEPVDDGREFGGNAQSVRAYRDTLTRDEAWHLLRRAAFGATPAQVDAAVAAGLSATVNDLLTWKAVPAEITALAESYEDNEAQRWLVYLIESPNPLHERLALFWHDRFATSGRILTYRDRNLDHMHLDMIRSRVLGDYREFLNALTIDPLMLLWLDGANSPKESPNENYAREFWELFTLGRDIVYTQSDIVEAARAFTGITLYRERDRDARPIFDILHHDETNKTIFPGRATAANYDYRSMIDLTLAQPEAPRYVARNLFVFFVHDHPSVEVVQQLADILVANNYRLEPLVRAILTSHAMFSSDAQGNQISTPVEHIAGVARTLDMHIYSEESQGYLFDQLASDLEEAGQELLNPPDVSGWGDNEYWLKDQWVLSRARALGRTMEYGPTHEADLPLHLLPPRDTWNVREVRKQMVDAIASVFHLHLAPDETESYINVLDQDGWRAFHLEDPRNQPQHVFEMIRLMAMHEDVICR